MKKDIFTGKMYFRLWWPAILSSIGWALSDMADAVVVGQRLGTTGLAAISLILPIYMMNCMVAHGFGLGGSVRFSHLLSKGDDQGANWHFTAILAGSMTCSILTAILGTIFMTPLLAFLGTRPEDGALFYATRDYLSILVLATPLFYLSNIMNYFLRNDSSQKRAGIGSLVGNVSDICLNIFLVLVVGLGTRGAALSTAIGQVIAIAIYLPGLFAPGHHLKPDFKKIKEAGFAKIQKEFLPSLKSGFATSVSYLYQMLFFLICNNLLMKISGEKGVAIFDLIQNISYLILYIYEGTSRAMQPILSTYYGERNVMGRNNATRIGFASGIGLGTLFIAAVTIFPHAFCMLFGITDVGIQVQAAAALRIYCFGAFFAGLSIMICNYYQSCECLRAVFLIETMRGAAILLPCTFIFSLLGQNNFWWLFPTTEIMTLLIFLGWKKFRNYHVQNGDMDRVFQYTIHSDVTTVSDVCGQIEEFCEKWHAGMKQQYFVTMTVEELCMAILMNGIKDSDNGYIQITVIASEDGKFKVHLRDNAIKFNPFDLETRKANEDGDVLMDSMGILVLKSKVDDFFYQRYQGFNSLVLTI